MKARDAVAVAALRSALAAIDNAEAVDPALAPSPEASDARVAKSVAGLGAADVPRRLLTPEEEAAIVGGEVSDRQAAAAEYDRLGRSDQAERLRAEAEVLAAHLP